MISRGGIHRIVGRLYGSFQSASRALDTFFSPPPELCLPRRDVTTVDLARLHLEGIEGSLSFRPRCFTWAKHIQTLVLGGAVENAGAHVLFIPAPDRVLREDLPPYTLWDPSKGGSFSNAREITALASATLRSSQNRNGPVTLYLAGDSSGRAYIARQDSGAGPDRIQLLEAVPVLGDRIASFEVKFPRIICCSERGETRELIFQAATRGPSDSAESAVHSPQSLVVLGEPRESAAPQVAAGFPPSRIACSPRLSIEISDREVSFIRQG